MSLGGVGATSAQPLPATNARLAISAQPLAAALNELSAATRVSIAFAPNMVAGKTAPPIAGIFTVGQALDRLLAGSGLTWVVEGNAVALKPLPVGVTSPAATLPEVRVTAVAETLEREASVRQRMATVTPDVIIDRAQIESLGDKRLSDISGRFPGTFAGGPPGEKKSINLRGVSSEFARFSFDGVNLPSSTGSRNIDLQRISSFIVEDVRYLRSPSAEYEGDGLAGRLVSRPRVVPETPVIELDAGLGGLDHLDGANRSLKFGYAGRVGADYGLVVAVGYDRYDSIKVKDRSELTYTGGGGPALNQGFMIDERDPKRNHSSNLFVDLVHYHDGGEIHIKTLVLDTLVENSNRVRDQYNRIPGTLRQRTLASGEEYGKTVGLTLDGKHRFANGVEIDGAITDSRARRTTLRNDLVLGGNLAFSSASASESRTDDELQQLTFNAGFPIQGSAEQRLKLGTMLRNSTRRSDSELFTVNASGVRSQTAADLTRSRNSDYEVRESYAAAYVQGELKLGQWTLLPGLRYETVETTTTGVMATNAKRNFSHWLPSLPVSYRWSDQWLLRASVARHVNRPKLDELAPGVATRGTRTFTGNPDLMPATARSLDIGADYSQGNVFLGFNWFQRDIRNLIETLEPTANNFVYRNVGDGVIRGVELEQRWRPAEGIRWLNGLTISANQAFLSSRVDDPLTGMRPFAEQPRFIANFNVEYRPAPLGFGASLAINHIGKRGIISYEGAGAIRDKTIRAETFVDLRSDWRFSRDVTLYGGIENLTNQVRDEFEYLNGALNRTAVIGTGRTFTVGLNVKWR